MVRTQSVVFTVRTIANVAIRILPANEHRAVWSAMNWSDTDIYWGYSQAVSLTGREKGWRIPANGGSVEDEHALDEVFIISTADGKELTVQEVTKVE